MLVVSHESECGGLAAADALSAARLAARAPQVTPRLQRVTYDLALLLRASSTEGIRRVHAEHPIYESAATLDDRLVERRAVFAQTAWLGLDASSQLAAAVAAERLFVYSTQANLQHRRSLDAAVMDPDQRRAYSERLRAQAAKGITERELDLVTHASFDKIAKALPAGECAVEVLGYDAADGTRSHVALKPAVGTPRRRWCRPEVSPHRAPLRPPPVPVPHSRVLRRPLADCDPPHRSTPQDATASRRQCPRC